MAALRYLSNVVTLTLDAQKCNGCGMCIAVCPHGVFQIQDQVAQIVDRDACMECGACAQNCPTQAVHVASGVGCVTAIIIGALRGTEPDCDCSQGSSCCS